MFRSLTSLIVLALLLGSGCAGIKSASPVSIEALRAGPVVADVGYTSGNGVPSLAARMSKRPGLKVAILQMAYAIQGRPEMHFTTDIWQFGGTTTWKSTTTPEIFMPPSLALACAENAATSLEQELTNQGFDVISHDEVAATAAYAKHYGEWPQGYTIESNGFTIVGSPPLRVKPITGLISFGQMHHLWPKAQALQEIEAELGGDVLFLCGKVESNTMQGLAGRLKVGAALALMDPDYVGYGIGGFGHWVIALDAHTERSGTPVPEFIEHLDDKQFKVHWTPVYEDLSRVNASFASGWAKTLRELATPQG